MHSASLSLLYLPVSFLSYFLHSLFFTLKPEIGRISDLPIVVRALLRLRSPKKPTSHAVLPLRRGIWLTVSTLMLSCHQLWHCASS